MMCSGKCGTCKYHKYNELDNDFYCDNEDSDYYTCYTDFEDECVDYIEMEK